MSGFMHTKRFNTLFKSGCNSTSTIYLTGCLVSNYLYTKSIIQKALYEKRGIVGFAAANQK